MWSKLPCVEYQHSYVDSFWVALTCNFPFILGVNVYWKMKSFMLTPSRISGSLSFCLCPHLQLSVKYILFHFCSWSHFFFLTCGPWVFCFSHKGRVLHYWSFTADYELLILEVNLPVWKAKFSSKEMPPHDGYYFKSILM